MGMSREKWAYILTGIVYGLFLGYRLYYGIRPWVTHDLGSSGDFGFVFFCIYSLLCLPGCLVYGVVWPVLDRLDLDGEYVEAVGVMGLSLLAVWGFIWLLVYIDDKFNRKFGNGITPTGGMESNDQNS